MLFLFVRFLHIASAIWFIGGLLARQIVRAHAQRTDDVHRFAAFSEAAGRIETTMVIPGNMAVIVIGVLLALLIKAPILGFLQGADRNWLLVSNLLLVIGLILVPLVFLPRGQRFGAALENALTREQMTPELRAALEDPVVKAAHLYEMIAMAVVVFLMVLKPF